LAYTAARSAAGWAPPMATTTVSYSPSSAATHESLRDMIPFPSRSAPVLPAPAPDLAESQSSPPAEAEPKASTMPVMVGDRRPPARLVNDECITSMELDMPRAEVEHGLGGNGVLGTDASRYTQSRLQQMRFVDGLPLAIQRGFRFKMMMLLWLQLGLTVLVSFLIRWALPGRGIALVFPAQSPQAAALVLCTFGALPLLSLVRDRHPWNLLATLAWTLLLGVAIGASQVPGGFILSNTFSLIFSNLFVGVGIVTIVSSCITLTDEYRHPYLVPFFASGTLAYVVMLAGTITVAVMVPGFYESIGHVVGAMLFTTCIFAWLCWEASTLSARMVPDDYLKAIIFFYTDFAWGCLCCAVLSLFSGSGSA